MNLEKEEDRWTEGKCVIAQNASYSCKEEGQSIVFPSDVVFFEGSDETTCGSFTAEGWCTSAKASNCNGESRPSSCVRFPG